MVWQAEKNHVKLKFTIKKIIRGSGCVWDKIFGDLLQQDDFELHASAKWALVASVEGEVKKKKMILESLECAMPFWSAAADATAAMGDGERMRKNEKWHRSLPLRCVR